MLVELQLTLEKKIANNPIRALEIASKIGTAAASRNPRAALSATPDLIKFATTGEGIKVVQKGRGLYLGTKKQNYLIMIIFMFMFMITIIGKYLY